MDAPTERRRAWLPDIGENTLYVVNTAIITAALLTFFFWSFQTCESMDKREQETKRIQYQSPGYRLVEVK